MCYVLKIRKGNQNIACYMELKAPCSVLCFQIRVGLRTGVRAASWVWARRSYRKSYYS
jgi:hypothetical protein